MSAHVAAALAPTPPNWTRPGLTVGADCRIADAVTIYASLERPVSIGRRTTIYRGAELNGPVSIGELCFVNRDLYARADTVIGDRCAIGPFVRLISDTHELGSATKRAGANVDKPIRIGAGTWIGAGVTVLGGVTVGEGCVIAAGAVVVSDVPPNTMVGGVPARHLRQLDA